MHGSTINEGWVYIQEGPSINSMFNMIVQSIRVEHVDGITGATPYYFFTYPESVLSLRGGVDSGFSISSFINLRELHLSDFPAASGLSAWIWPYNTLEVLDFQPANIYSTKLPVSWWLNNYHLFPVLRFMRGTWDCGTDDTPIVAEITSETLQFLSIDLVDSATPLNLTINCPTCLNVTLTWNTSTVNITAPNLDELYISNKGASWPHLLTPLPNLTELTVISVGENEPLVEFPDLDFAPSLRSFEWRSQVIDHTNWIRVLCSLPPTLRSLSLSAMYLDQPMQLPSCLRNLTTATFDAQEGQKYNSDALFLNLTSSITSLTLSNALNEPISIDNLKRFIQLRSVYIGDSNMVGDIPADFFQTLPQLSDFYCWCSVTGAIPSVGWNAIESFSISAPVTSWEGIDSAPNLVVLLTRKETLTRLPSDDMFLAANLQSLLSIDIQLGLTGPVPTFWTSLPNIEYVTFANNQLSGPFNATISSPMLRGLHMEYNRICGPLPEFTVTPRLTYLALHDNQFSGSIPDSWPARMPYLVELQLFSNPINGTIPSGLMGRVVYQDLSNTNLVGPIWNMSQFLPQSIFIVNSGIDICLVDPQIPVSNMMYCNFDNVPACPSDCQAYWPCTSFTQCHNVTFIPQVVGECMVDPPINPSESPQDSPYAFPVDPPYASPVDPPYTSPQDTPYTSPQDLPPTSPQLPPSTSSQCPPPAPPGFACIDTQYISNGSVTLEVVTLPAQAGIIVVKGNLSVNGPLTFTGLGSTIEIEGCLDVAPNQVHIDLTSLDDLHVTTLINQKGTDCATDLSKIPVILDNPKDGCKKAKVSTSQSTRSSLVVAFTLDSSRCNVKWIILGCVLGGVVILVVVAVVLLQKFNSSFRRFTRRGCCRK